MKSVRSLLVMVLCALLWGVAVPNANALDETRPDGATTSQDHGTWQEKRFVAVVDDSGVQRVDILGGGYFFDPNVIVVKVRIPVELKVKKEPGYIPHSMVVHAPEAGIDFKVNLTSDVQTVTFTPTKPGRYPLYCDKSLLWFKNHREKGMEGVIEVVE